MYTILKIKEIGLNKLNNAEYTQFLSYTHELIEKITLEKLALTEQEVQGFKKNIDLLTEQAMQSRISNETKKLEEIDKQRNEILSFLLMNFRSEQKNPIEGRKKAGTELYNLTKPYRKIKSIPVRQKTQVIESLVSDITKEGVSQHLVTLGIKEAVDTLTATNLKYKKLIADRADNQTSIIKINIKELRNETNKIYDYLMTKAFANSIIVPSQESYVFVNSMNKLILDTETAYKQRVGQKKEKQW